MVINYSFLKRTILIICFCFVIQPAVVANYCIKSYVVDSGNSGIAKSLPRKSLKNLEPYDFSPDKNMLFANSDLGIKDSQPCGRVKVGRAYKLRELTGKTTDKLQWSSSNPSVAKIYGDGYVVGLKPGATFVEVAGDDIQKQCKVIVKPEQTQLLNPQTLQQYPDNRVFYINGRRHVGSELNGVVIPPEYRDYTLSSRIINPHPIGDYKIEWKVRDGSQLFDGTGKLLGTVASWLDIGEDTIATAKFNYGTSKIIDGRLHVYAWATRTIPRDNVDAPQSERIGISGWLPLTEVVEVDALLKRLNMGDAKLPRLPLEKQSFRITGGDQDTYMTDYGEISIIENIKFGAVPSHYLRRPGGLVNVIFSVPGFSLGGQGLDSFLIDNYIVFRPAEGAKRFVMPTYFPSGHPKEGQISDKTMTFIYGAVKAEGSKTVYGWVAKEALTPIP